jgi:hypothetical protein
MLCSLASGNNPNRVAAFSVRHCHHLIFQQTRGEESLFAVGFAIILDRRGEAAKDLLSVREVNAVLSKIGASLCLVPGEHTYCSYGA